MATKDSEKTISLRKDRLAVLTKNRPCVIVVEGPSIGKQVRLEADELVIGRSEEAVVQLDDKLISREHAKLVAERDGDRTTYYIVDQGRVEVTADGRHVADLGSGDYFGEIALLRDVPRTATVTATQETRLLSLERDHFLAAVTGFAWSHLEVDRVAVERLNELERRAK